ncbi:MAG: CPBP family intramembrane glutamic endopeptidase [Clostridia bacterium]|jgi:membrane protease YdiL (CAAX protease family)|nr:CPBP family intramembrane glutamic endopeptidase [Clostridia bacterium]
MDEQRMDEQPAGEQPDKLFAEQLTDEERRPPGKPAWGVLEALSVIVLTFGIRTFIPLQNLALYQKLSRQFSPDNPLFGAIFLESLLQALLILGLIALWLKLKYRLPWRELGLQRESYPGWAWLGFKQGLLLFVGVTLLSMLLITVYPFEVKPQQSAEVFSAAATWQQMFLVTCVVSLLAPISEEMYFRGFLYPALRKRFGRIAAIILAGAFFGLLHFDLLRFIPITLGGVWLTLLYERTGSLYPAIMAHAVWNALMISVVFLSAALTAA